MKKGVLKLMMMVVVLMSSGINMNAQAVSHPHSGPTGSWRLLGTVSANHTADHDVIAVKGNI
jgi:hypothetical protein